MKHPLPKNFAGKIDWTIVGAVLLGVGFLGTILYANYQIGELTAKIEETEVKLGTTAAALDEKVRTLAEVFESTLSEEERQRSDLREELRDINRAVGTLGRVATTDRDLLRKYSKTYFLNENYTPLELTTIDSKYQSGGGTNFKILSDVWPYLLDLFEETEAQGLELRALSAYRSFGTQSALKASYVVTYGEGANAFSADQGYSEHQLGTALDFTTEIRGGTLQGFEATEEYQWLLENAHKYGFILSYPAGNAYYKFEPWHWRFVGVELAKRLHKDNKNFYDMDQREIDSYLPKIFD